MNAPLFSEKKSMALSWIGMRGLKYGLIDIKRVPNQPLINRTNKKTCNEIFATDTCRPMPLYPKTKNVAVQWIEFRVSSQIHVRIVPFFSMAIQSWPLFHASQATYQCGQTLGESSGSSASCAGQEGKPNRPSNKPFRFWLLRPSKYWWTLINIGISNLNIVT